MMYLNAAQIAILRALEHGQAFYVSASEFADVAAMSRKGLVSVTNTSAGVPMMGITPTGKDWISRHRPAEPWAAEAAGPDAA
jgi:hypothetical protein